jgi:hypothetical protein
MRDTRNRERTERNFYRAEEKRRKKTGQVWKVIGSGKFDNPKGVPDRVVITKYTDDYIVVEREYD